MHTNDLHARILPFASKSLGNDVSGAIRRASFIKTFKQSAPQTLVLDAGDMFQGTPFFNFFKGEACYRIASAIGYDATTMGNHELDLSLENLFEKLQTSGMKLLCCNVFFRKNDRPAFSPYSVFRRNGKNVIVIGSIGDSAWEDIDIKNKAPLYQQPQIEAVRNLAQKLRKSADLIIVLSHSGLDEDLKMAAEIAEIDVIIGGHTHQETPHPIFVTNRHKSDFDNGLNGTIVAQAGEHGIYVGKLGLTFSDESGKIATFSGNLEKIDENTVITEVSDVENLVSNYFGKLDQQIKRVVGDSATGLDYPKDLKKTHLLPMGTFTAIAMKEHAGADVCLVNSGGIRAGIKPGKITCGQIFEALPYDNTVVTFSMTGNQVKQMLEYICSNSEELDGFQYAGLSGELNFKMKMAIDIKIDGKPIVPAKIYRVCTSSFVANGNLGGDKIFAHTEGVEDSGTFMRDAAIKYLENNGNLPDFTRNKLKLVFD